MSAMEHLEYEFGPYPALPAESAVALAGVVSSGNMEVLLEPRPLDGRLRFVIDTSIEGYADTWRAVAQDFAEQHRVGDLLVTVNDAGATPSVVTLRLAQAMEEVRR